MKTAFALLICTASVHVAFQPGSPNRARSAEQRLCRR